MIEQLPPDRESRKQCELGSVIWIPAIVVTGSIHCPDPNRFSCIDREGNERWSIWLGNRK